jgi:energy-coupling factor transporter ATP-binding protein EcfA2
VDWWVERLGLTPYVGVKLAELSKGTAQKVGLAQALLCRPDLLVLDEPWEGLDAAARELVPELIDEVRASGGAVLLSDHRGETARLPKATCWSVADGMVIAGVPTGGSPGGTAGAHETYLVEVAVAATDAQAAAARLHAAGHRVLGVRPMPATPVPAPRDPDLADGARLDGGIG